MLRLFYPDYYAQSVFSIDYEALFSLGCRGIIFDIDNTLVPHGEGATPQTDELLNSLKAMGFKTFLLSDNGVIRIEKFIQNVDIEYIDNANKPNPKSYKKAVQRMGLKKGEVICIGDQIFTDILGANLSGIKSILVKYIGYDEEGYKGKRRAAEEAILKRYKASAKYNKLGKIER